MGLQRKKDCSERKGSELMKEVCLKEGITGVGFDQRNVKMEKSEDDTGVEISHQPALMFQTNTRK